MASSTVPSRDRVEPGSVNVPPLAEWPATSTSESADPKQVAQTVVNTFEDALHVKDHSKIVNLFLQKDSFWRDHLALSWDLRTLQGRDKIHSYLRSSATPLTKVEIDFSSTFRAPRFSPIDALWGDVKGILFFIRFETKIGRGQGYITLAEKNGEWKIFTVSTVLTELKGFEEPVNGRRTKGVQHGGNPDRKNWRETREVQDEFLDQDPAVLIIGERGFSIVYIQQFSY